MSSPSIIVTGTDARTLEYSPLGRTVEYEKSVERKENENLAGSKLHVTQGLRVLLRTNYFAVETDAEKTLLKHRVDIKSTKRRQLSTSSKRYGISKIYA